MLAYASASLNLCPRHTLKYGMQYAALYPNNTGAYQF